MRCGQTKASPTDFNPNRLKCVKPDLTDFSWHTENTKSISDQLAVILKYLNSRASLWITLGAIRVTFSGHFKQKSYDHATIMHWKAHQHKRPAVRKKWPECWLCLHFWFWQNVKSLKSRSLRPSEVTSHLTFTWQITGVEVNKVAQNHQVCGSESPRFCAGFWLAQRRTASGREEAKCLKSNLTPQDEFLLVLRHEKSKSLEMLLLHRFCRGFWSWKYPSMHFLPLLVATCLFNVTYIS